MSVDKSDCGIRVYAFLSAQAVQCFPVVLGQNDCWGRECRGQLPGKVGDSKGFMLGVSQKYRIYASFCVSAAWKVKGMGSVLTAAEVMPKWERWKSFSCCLFLFLEFIVHGAQPAKIFPEGLVGSHCWAAVPALPVNNFCLNFCAVGAGGISQIEVCFAQVRGLSPTDRHKAAALTAGKYE